MRGNRYIQIGTERCHWGLAVISAEGPSVLGNSSELVLEIRDAADTSIESVGKRKDRASRCGQTSDGGMLLQETASDDGRHVRDMLLKIGNVNTYVPMLTRRL